MAEWVQNDTWPPQRGRAEDDDGPLDLVSADAVVMVMKHSTGTPTIRGTATVIDPIDEDGFNWQYTWAANDLAVAGSYDVELEVTWDSGSSPPKVETVPNGDPANITVRAEKG